MLVNPYGRGRASGAFEALKKVGANYAGVTAQLDAKAGYTGGDPKNLYNTANQVFGENATDARDNAMIFSNGTVNVNADTYNAYFVTAPVALSGGVQYTLSVKPWGIAEITNTSKGRCYSSLTTFNSTTALPEIVWTENADGTVTFTTPVGTKCIRFTAYCRAWGGTDTGTTAISAMNNALMLVSGGQSNVPATYEPYFDSYKKLDGVSPMDGSVERESLSPACKSDVLPLQGKTIVNFGDSIFGNSRPPLDISTEIASITGATVHNCAFGGCQMSAFPGFHWDAFSMYRLAYSIANNDYAIQDDALLYEDRPSYAETPLALLKTIDFTKVYAITIAYGTNDYASDVGMENSEDLYDCAYFAGALRYSIETLLGAFPHLKIMVFTPTYRFWIDGSNVFTEDSDTRVNAKGAKLTDFVDKTIEIAKEYKIPCLDNYNELGINKFNRMIYFAATDGVHHIAAGRTVIARKVSRALEYNF